MTQPSDEIVERVARAICDELTDATNGQWPVTERDMRIARAAITATGLVEEVERVREEAFRAGCEVGLGKAAWADVDVLWQEYQALAEKPTAKGPPE